MIDLEEQLEQAASDVRANVRSDAAPTASTIVRRARRRPFAVAATVTLLVVGASSLIFGGSAGGDVAVGSGDLITSEEILADGIVTEEEYRAGAVAAVECLARAGLDYSVEFNFEGFANFIEPKPFDHSTIPTANACFESHLSENVHLGWHVVVGQVDLDEYRTDNTALFECVEARTGQDFGEFSFNGFGYPTKEGREAAEAALEYQEAEAWVACQEDLGLRADEG